MHEQDLETGALKAMALMAQFERRCHQLEQHQQALMEQLQRAIGGVPGQVAQSADRMLSSFPKVAATQLEHGLEHSITQYEQRLGQSTAQLQDRMGQLASHVRRLDQLCRHLVWKTAASVIGALLIAIIGGSWLLWYYQGELRNSQVSAELMHAYNQADVTLCGGRLCVNVDKSGQKYGEHGQYLLAKPR
ncbi:relaxation protein [Dyella sp.]|uniref:relaxation protein n=1 Tax=Dyella sp. TaxID=1869338 RepID=UPI002B47FC4C|nr:relaxation protein [Dyella sp.]HKT30613.1 relaxation protein [Dyella sp.]